MLNHYTKTLKKIFGKENILQETRWGIWSKEDTNDKVNSISFKSFHKEN